MGFGDGDISLGNIPKSDKDAKDSIPDLLVHYFIAGGIDKPTLRDIQEYYPDYDTPKLQEEQLEFMQHHHKIRAGIQVAFRCCVLIGEVKPLSVQPAFQEGTQGDPLLSERTPTDGTNPPKPSRQPVSKRTLSKLEGWTSSCSFGFSNAVKQVMFYCAIHFFIQNEWDKVIVLPAIGPYWRWGWALRNEIPVYDWTTGEVMDTQEDREKSTCFLKQFPWELGSCHTFGTKESDQQFTTVCDQILSVFGSIPDPTVLPTKYNFRLFRDRPLI